LASASIAQVQILPKLHSGEDGVIKSYSSKIEKTTQQGILVCLYLGHNLVANRVDDGRRLRPVEFVTDYEYNNILDEWICAKESRKYGVVTT